MSQKTKYPFYTEIVEGEEMAGIAFNPNNAKFYEFQDPDTHDDYAYWVCPRDRDEITHRSFHNYMMSRLMINIANLNAKEWAEFREEYINADDKVEELFAEYMNSKRYWVE